jgi:hypothetical protein
MRTIFSFFMFIVISGVSLSSSAGEPAIDGRAQGELRSRCVPAPLQPGYNQGTIDEQDCLYTGGGTDQYEDLYIISQGRLKSNRPDSMATYTLEDGGFDWIFGLGPMSGAIFPDPVTAFRRGNAGVWDIDGFAINTFSLIGSDPTYKMFVGGQDPAQLGNYALTASEEPVSNTCEKNHRVYLHGDVSFSSSISSDNSCLGEVVIGPNLTVEINYQYWWVRVSPGDTISMSLDNVEDETVAAAIIEWGVGWDLDLGDGEGDTDRSVTYTAENPAYIYVEVSSASDRESDYTLQFETE